MKLSDKIINTMLSITVIMIVVAVWLVAIIPLIKFILAGVGIWVIYNIWTDGGWL